MVRFLGSRFVGLLVWWLLVGWLMGRSIGLEEDANGFFKPINQPMCTAGDQIALACWLVGWLVGWLGSKLVGWLVGWLVDGSICVQPIALTVRSSCEGAFQQLDVFIQTIFL